MRKLSLLFLGALAFAQNIQPTHTHLKEGDEAPDFTLPVAGSRDKVTLSDLRGKSNVVLAFFPAAFTGG